jgi:hypothetical protein
LARKSENAVKPNIGLLLVTLAVSVTSPNIQEAAR